MGRALDGDGFKSGIGEDDFLKAARGWIAGISGLDIHFQQGTHFGQFHQETAHHVSGFGIAIFMAAIEAQAAAHLHIQALTDAGDEFIGHQLQLLGRNGFIRKKAGEEQMKKIFAQSGNGSF